jgi:hypothetical protein
VGFFYARSPGEARSACNAKGEVAKLVTETGGEMRSLARIQARVAACGETAEIGGGRGRKGRRGQESWVTAESEAGAGVDTVAKERGVQNGRRPVWTRE